MFFLVNSSALADHESERIISGARLSFAHNFESRLKIDAKKDKIFQKIKMVRFFIISTKFFTVA
jgi:hypothetical protein